MLTPRPNLVRERVVDARARIPLTREDELSGGPFSRLVYPNIKQFGSVLANFLPQNFAAKIEQGGGSLKEQVSRAWYAAVGRPPERKELRALVSYTREHWLANACRVLFNLNEFSFVD